MTKNSNKPTPKPTPTPKPIPKPVRVPLREAPKPKTNNPNRGGGRPPAKG